MKRIILGAGIFCFLFSCNKKEEEKAPQQEKTAAIDSFSTQHYKMLERTDYRREFKSKGPGVPGYDEVNTQSTTILGYTEDIRFDTLFDKKEVLYQGKLFHESTGVPVAAPAKVYLLDDMTRLTFRDDSIFVFKPGFQSQMVSETSLIKGVRL